MLCLLVCWCLVTECNGEKPALRLGSASGPSCFTPWDQSAGTGPTEPLHSKGSGAAAVALTLLAAGGSQPVPAELEVIGTQPEPGLSQPGSQSETTPSHKGSQVHT